MTGAGAAVQAHMYRSVRGNCSSTRTCLNTTRPRRSSCGKAFWRPRLLLKACATPPWTPACKALPASAPSSTVVSRRKIDREAGYGWTAGSRSRIKWW